MEIGRGLPVLQKVDAARNHGRVLRAGGMSSLRKLPIPAVLLSPDSAYVTGQLIAVDGGYPAQGL